MNALTQIIEKCDQVFERAWQKECERLTPILERYIEARNENENGANLNDCVYAVTGDKTRNYNNIDIKTYNAVKKITPIMGLSYRKGIDSALYSIRYKLKEDLMWKLHNSIKKHEVLHITTVKNVNVSTSNKGFTVRTELENGAVFTTDCIEAGGHNIQQFHYRYISKLS